jgi:hypothetical protein
MNDDITSNTLGSQPGNNNITDSSHLGQMNPSSQITATNAIFTSAPEKTPAQQAEQRRIGSFPADLSGIKPVFSVKSKNSQAKERFTQKA